VDTRANPEIETSTAVNTEEEMRLQGQAKTAPLTIASDDVTLEEASRVIHEGAQVALDPADLEELARAGRQLELYARDHIVYGLNTGFGPMATHRISNADGQSLQLNLIRSHALGSGRPLPEAFVRATMLCRRR